MTEQDSHFISGDYAEIEIPKKYQFLTRYFETEIQQVFLRYFWVFREWRSFVDHTGIYCGERYLRKQAERFQKLMDAHADATSILDEDHMRKLQILTEGKYKLS